MPGRVLMKGGSIKMRKVPPLSPLPSQFIWGDIQTYIALVPDHGACRTSHTYRSVVHGDFKRLVTQKG